MRGTKSAFLPGTGTIVLGTGDGIVTFDPSMITISSVPPPVVITDILAPVNLESKEGIRSLVQFRLPERVDLPYDRSAVEIRFAALDFLSPAQNTYAIRMEGIGQSWLNVGTRHSVYYGGLSPGEYVFRVRAANNDGVWNTTGASVRVVVNPPFWSTLWFRIVAALAIASVVVFLTRMRYVRQLELERLRVRIANDLHDEVGSSLSSIALLTDLVRDTLPESRRGRRELIEISQISRQTAETLRDIVWLINPDHDHFEKLVDRMKDTARLLLGKIPFTFSSNAENVGAAVNMEFRRNFLMAYKEMLHNISAHAHAKAVSIELEHLEVSSHCA